MGLAQLDIVFDLVFTPSAETVEIKTRGVMIVDAVLLNQPSVLPEMFWVCLSSLHSLMNYFRFLKYLFCLLFCVYATRKKQHNLLTVTSHTNNIFKTW